MTIKEFIMKSPYALNIKDADRISKAAELMYDFEIDNKDSVFARRKEDNESLERRYLPFFKMIDDAEDKNDLEITKKIIIYAGILHDGNEDYELKKEIQDYNPELYTELFGENIEKKGSVWNS